MSEESAKILQKVSPLLAESRILIFKGRKSKEEVLKALIRSIAGSGEFGEYDDLEWGIFHREELMSTGIGNALATPHLALPNIEKGCIAIGICPDGIGDYHSLDGQGVKIVFMIITSKLHKNSHLKLLASISHMMYDGRFKAAFLAAPDAATCLKIVERAEE